MKKPATPDATETPITAPAFRRLPGCGACVVLALGDAVSSSVELGVEACGSCLVLVADIGVSKLAVVVSVDSGVERAVFSVVGSKLTVVVLWTVFVVFDGGTTVAVSVPCVPRNAPGTESQMA